MALKFWNRPPLQYLPEEIWKDGKEILEALLRLSEEPDHSPGTFVTIHGISSVDSTTPAMRHVYRDLFSLSGTSELSMIDYNVKETRQLDSADLIESLSQDRHHTQDDRVHLYGALAIPATRQGILSASMFLGPYSQTDNNSFLMVKSGELAWDSGVVPAGGVTDVHTDLYGAPSWIQHIEGLKLWLLWPSTKKNRESFFGQPKEVPMCIETAFKTLEGLQVLRVGPKQMAFKLPPQCLHAVITLATSAHAGIPVVSFEDFELASQIMAYTLEKSHGFKQAQYSAHWDNYYTNFLDTVEENDLSLWEGLIKRNPGHALVGPIKKWIATTRSEVEKCKQVSAYEQKKQPTAQGRSRSKRQKKSK